MRIEDAQKAIPLIRERTNILNDIAQVEGFMKMEDSTFRITLHEEKKPKCGFIPIRDSVNIHVIGRDEMIRFILDNLYYKLKIVEEKINLI